MALSNRERMHEAIESLRVGLTPFVERMFQAKPMRTARVRARPFWPNCSSSLARAWC
jgi:hypothetical protein